MATVISMRNSSKLLNMVRKSSVLIALAVVLALSNIYLFNLLLKRNTEISQQKSSNNILKGKFTEQKHAISQLEEKVEKYEDLVQEYQSALAKVKYFNIPSRSFSRRTGVSYIGSALETRIDGTFKGWDGDTIFKMRDGSIWQQVSYDYTYHYAYAPDVLIYSKNGSNYMSVEGVDDEIRVIRIK